MNTFRDLLHRHAHPLGLAVDDREWLLLCELDPQLAAAAMTNLVLLASDTFATAVAHCASTVLSGATARRDADPHATRHALGGIDRFISGLNRRADALLDTWIGRTVPDLIDTGVLQPTLAPELCCLRRPPRRWTASHAHLPGLAGHYPVLAAARRRQAGRPILRIDLPTCRRLAADLASTRAAHVGLRPAILVNGDTPILAIGAADIERAWQADAQLVFAEADGRYQLGGRTWPWRLCHR